MRLFKSSVLAAAAVACPFSAMADVCVTCSGPAAAYSCTVKKADQIEALAGANAVNKICAQVLKQKGSHKSCTAETVGSCPGAATLIGWKDVKEAIAAGLDDTDKPAATTAPAKKPSTAAKDAPPPQPPAAKAVSPPPAAATADAARATGPAPTAATPTKPPPPIEPEPSFADKLKGGADKTWKCVSSFFGEC